MRDEPPARYTLTAITLHWVSAVLVFTLLAIGWTMVDLPRGPGRSFYFALHKSFGLTVFTLTIFRIVWRFFHQPPRYPESMAYWRITIARSAHLLLYILLCLQPVSGYLSSSFSGYKTKIFGIALPHWGWQDPPLNEFFTEIHVMSSVLFMILLGTHLMGILSHVFERRDRIFRRILPW